MKISRENAGRLKFARAYLVRAGYGLDYQTAGFLWFRNARAMGYCVNLWPAGCRGRDELICMATGRLITVPKLGRNGLRPAPPRVPFVF